MELALKELMTVANQYMSHKDRNVRDLALYTFIKIQQEEQKKNAEAK